MVGSDGNNENVINMMISVPSYIIRGAGTASHYEYEVRIVVQDDSWTLLRRYRRFRELYNSMRQKYDSKVRWKIDEIIIELWCLPVRVATIGLNSFRSRQYAFLRVSSSLVTKLSHENEENVWKNIFDV